MTGLPVQLSQSELALLTRGEAWLALIFGMSVLKGVGGGGGGGGGGRGGGDENKNKFEKLKANRSQS